MPRCRGTRYALLKSPAAPAVRRLYDTFTDADATALTAHTMNQGGGWTAHLGTFTVQSNRARPATYVASEVLASADAGFADATATLTVRDPAGTGSATALAFRVAGATNFWMAYLVSGSDTFDLWENNAGVYTLRASTPFTVGTTDHVITAVTSGTSIAVRVDGANELTYSSSLHQAATRYGLYVFDSSGLIAFEFDDFQVDA